VAALTVTFLVSGVWHGASWGYIAWGLLHGMYLSVATLYKPVQMKMHRVLHLEKSRLLELWQIGITFHLVCFSWVFFRAKTVSDAYHIVTNLFIGVGNVSDLLFLNGTAELLITVCTLGIVLFVDSRPKTWTFEDTFFQKPFFLRWSVYTVLVLSTLFLAIDSVNLFIYTQF
jgi:alginate O-acetyltransferase complex protein AlgI